MSRTGSGTSSGTAQAKPAQASRNDVAVGPVVALAGGVGAAKLLRGLVPVAAPDEVVAIVNTGDDCEFYGVHVSPDLDIVTYTLGGVVEPKLGFGLAGDSFHLVERLATLGHESWFRLGDRDFANCLHRTLRLRAGAGLAEVSDELRRAHDLTIRILPMSEDPCPTRVALDDGSLVHFEEYLVRDGAPDAVHSVDLSAAQEATPGPGVLEAIARASAIVLCPSNPVVSIGPILAIPGIRDAVKASSAPVVAVSPIVGGAAVKGPAAQLLRGTGCEVSARGVAGLYRDLLDGMLIDERDAAQAGDLESLGIRPAVCDTLMIDLAASQRVATRALELARELARARSTRVSLALVPVKQLAASKSRLLPELDREQLQQLALAMLGDVIEALRGVAALERIVVATPDARVAEAARAAGADPLLRPDGGLNAAIDAAAKDLLRPGEPFLVVLGDVAGTRSEEIQQLFDCAAELSPPCAVLAPSRDGGTSALLRTPWNAIPSRFGRDSAKAHRDAASSAGVAFRELALPSLAIDLDRAEDLALFVEGASVAPSGRSETSDGDGWSEPRCSAGARTRALLHALGWTAPDAAEGAK